ncbi:hypothetical protein [Providencia hangzhouensis]|uniref:hypothetical protein n=1 Tax=Providencia hangzhouensis TaxID=3031799 RepID=UPI0039795F69
MNNHIVVHTIPNIIQKMKNEGIACTEDSIIGIWKNHHIEFDQIGEEKGIAILQEQRITMKLFTQVEIIFCIYSSMGLKVETE